MKNKCEIVGDTVLIEFKYKDQKLKTLIDLDMLDVAASIKGTWMAIYTKSMDSFYVYCLKNRKALPLHRLITNAPPGLVVDHINHNTLDNRKSNLRVVTHAENLQNAKGPSKNSKSGVRGVYWHQTKRKWRTQIRVNGIAKSAGDYDNLEDAKNAVIAARKMLMPHICENIST